MRITAFGTIPLRKKTRTRAMLFIADIQLRRVMLEMVSEERLLIVWQRRSTTFSNVWNTSFLKPFVRNSRHICSIGFISGVYGGMLTIVMLSGITIAVDLCHDAPSQTRIMSSLTYSFESSARKTFMHTVLQYGIIRKNPSPVSGSTAPNAYRYSRI